MKINETVLICEKNRGFLTALTLLVQKEFEEVITECDHENITKILQEKEVGIIVLDTGANLPSEQKEHLDFIKKICALGRDIQIVVFTNFSQNPFGLQAADAGAFDFVSKPWNNEKLTVTLRNAHKMRKLSLALKNGKGEAAGTLERSILFFTDGAVIHGCFLPVMFSSFYHNFPGNTRWTHNAS